MSATGERVALVCPQCGLPLAATPAGRKCSGCGNAWHRDGSVLVAASHPANTYYGEFPRQRLREVLCDGPTVGYGRAFSDHLGPLPTSQVTRYALDRRRALLAEFAEVPEHAVILDIGCGYGVLGQALAGSGRAVVFVDSTLERCEFAVKRCQELGNTQVTGLVTADWTAVPLPKDSVDVAIVNGVLEWVGSGTPRQAIEAQMGFLRHVAALLRPGGMLLLGIENRYALRYFYKTPDNHSRLPFASIMPRPVANLYSRIASRKPYSTLTWSYGEHETRLRACGFGSVKMVALWPDYRYPERACYLEDREGFRGLLQQAAAEGSREAKVLLVLARLGLAKRFVYSFGVIATKHGTS